MPLSDREKELLAEMERALSADDPRLVSTLTGKGPTPQRKRIAVGIALLGLGLVVLLGGLISQTIPLGIGGFLISLTGVVLAISSAPTPALGKAGSGKKKSNWSARLEERWDRRNEA